MDNNGCRRACGCFVKKTNPLGTVIIENKSNGEEDQTEPIVPMLV